MQKEDCKNVGYVPRSVKKADLDPPFLTPLTKYALDLYC
jgi:hypothetical protein